MQVDTPEQSISPRKAPTEYQQITLLCTMHLLSVTTHLCQIQAYLHNPLQTNLIFSCATNKQPSNTLIEYSSLY